MSMHRQNGSGDLASDVRRGFGFTHIFTVGVMVCFVLLMYTMAQHADDIDDQQLRALAEAERTQLQMPLKVRDAYERGMSDALEALKDTPDGVQLAQACMAQGLRPVDGSQQ